MYTPRQWRCVFPFCLVLSSNLRLIVYWIEVLIYIGIIIYINRINIPIFIEIIIHMCYNYNVGITMGLQKRASLYCGACLLFLVGILVFIGVWAVGETTERSLSERVAVVQMVARGIDRALLTAQDKLEKVSQLIDFEDRDTYAELETLDNLYTFSQAFSHIFLIDTGGEVIAVQPLSLSEDAQELVTADPGVREVLYTSQAKICCVFLSPLYKDYTFSVSIPNYGRNGKVAGVVTGYVELDEILGSFIKPLGLGSTAYTEVVNEDGIVMAISRSPAEASPGEMEYAPHFTYLIQQGKASMETCFRCHDTGKEIIRTREVLAFAPLVNVSGGVVIRQSEAESLAPSHRLVRYMVIAGSTLLVIGVIFTWLYTRTLVRPVLQLTAASWRIAEGNLDVPITVHSSDELGLLAQALDQMRLGLKESLSQKEELAIVEERTRLSREMHDSLGQVLGYLGLKADEIGILLTTGRTEQAIKRIKKVRKVIRNASDDVRHLILALRTPASPEVGLSLVLQDYLESFQQQTDIKISMDIQDGKATRFSAKVALQLMRVIQEALNNVRKHADASQVAVSFRIVSDEALISIADEGIGFDPSAIYNSGRHFGIQMMKERISDLGGSLEIDSQPGKGTRVLAKLPLEVRDETTGEN